MPSWWMSKEASREKHEGAKGSFTRIAELHGRSVPEEAEADKHKPGKIGGKARMASMTATERKAFARMGVDARKEATAIRAAEKDGIRFSFVGRRHKGKVNE